MDKKNDGGAAFPSPETDHLLGECGMSLRDWFAGQALMGTLSNPNTISPGGDRMNKIFDEAISKRCYQIADAMIAEREK